MRLFSVLLMLLGAAAGCGAVDEIIPLPSALEGTWTTDDERYEGRFFELTRTSVVIGTGDGRASSYPIAAVILTDDEQGRAIHVVEYLDGAMTHTMAFYFSTAEPGGTVRMKNQPTIVWRKPRG